MIDWYIEYEYWVAVVQLVLAMLGMGAGLRVSDFQKVVLKPKAVNVGLLMQLVIVPLTALLFILATDLPPGMILVSPSLPPYPAAPHLISLPLWPGAMCPYPSASPPSPL